jgi:hypothetical protein
MNRAQRRAPKIAVQSADENRRSSRTDTADDVRILLSTTRFRAHDAESTPGFLGASTRRGTSTLGNADESGRDS